MIPQKTIEELIVKHSTLEQDLSSGKIDKKLFAEKSKEYSDLNEIIQNAKKYIAFEKDKIELEKILGDQSSDKELIEMLKDGCIEHEDRWSEANNYGADGPVDQRATYLLMQKAATRLEELAANKPRALSASDGLC